MSDGGRDEEHHNRPATDTVDDTSSDTIVPHASVASPKQRSEVCAYCGTTITSSKFYNLTNQGELEYIGHTPNHLGPRVLKDCDRVCKRHYDLNLKKEKIKRISNNVSSSSGSGSGSSTSGAPTDSQESMVFSEPFHRRRLPPQSPLTAPSTFPGFTSAKMSHDTSEHPPPVSRHIVVPPSTSPSTSTTTQTTPTTNSLFSPTFATSIQIIGSPSVRPITIPSSTSLSTTIPSSSFSATESSSLPQKQILKMKLPPSSTSLLSTTVPSASTPFSFSPMYITPPTKSLIPQSSSTPTTSSTTSSAPQPSLSSLLNFATVLPSSVSYNSNVSSWFSKKFFLEPSPSPLTSPSSTPSSLSSSTSSTSLPPLQAVTEEDVMKQRFRLPPLSQAMGNPFSFEAPPPSSPSSTTTTTTQPQYSGPPLHGKFFGIFHLNGKPEKKIKQEKHENRGEHSRENVEEMKVKVKEEKIETASPDTSSPSRLFSTSPSTTSTTTSQKRISENLSLHPNKRIKIDTSTSSSTSPTMLPPDLFFFPPPTSPSSSALPSSLPSTTTPSFKFPPISNFSNAHVTQQQQQQHNQQLHQQQQHAQQIQQVQQVRQLFASFIFQLFSSQKIPQEKFNEIMEEANRQTELIPWLEYTMAQVLSQLQATSSAVDVVNAARTMTQHFLYLNSQQNFTTNELDDLFIHWAQRQFHRQ